MILELKHINFSFSPRKPIFEGFSFLIEKKQIYALMGSNGAGKTTLFNLITGFIKPASGEIFFSSSEKTEIQISDLSPYKINQAGISRTFQDLRIITKLTVEENIILSIKKNPTDGILNALLPQSFHRKTNLALKKKASEIMDQFFLSEVKNSLAAEISYGQQKLLTLACCVANGASLLLLDEPVAGIQPEYRNKIVLLIKQLKEQGITILLIEHNSDFIADVADQIFFLHEGKISAFPNIQTLRNDPLITEAYI